VVSFNNGYSATGLQDFFQTFQGFGWILEMFKNETDKDMVETLFFERERKKYLPARTLHFQCLSFLHFLWLFQESPEKRQLK